MTHQSSVPMRIETDWREELAQWSSHTEIEDPTLGHYLGWLAENEHTPQDLAELPAGLLNTLNSSSLF